MQRVYYRDLLKFCSSLERIQDLTKGGSDKRPPKAVAPRGVRGRLPWKIFNFRASEMRFPAFSGEIWSSLIALKSPWFTFFFVIRFYVQFTGFDRTTRTTPRSAVASLFCCSAEWRHYFAMWLRRMVFSLIQLLPCVPQDQHRLWEPECAWARAFSIPGTKKFRKFG